MTALNLLKVATLTAALGLTAFVANMSGHGAGLHAEELSQPTGEVLVAISGNIGNSNGSGAALFDREMLEALPVSEFTTTTIWTDGDMTFTGVALADLLSAVGANGAIIRATAVNDYSIEIPLDSISADAPIIAYKINGEEMSVRDKGPLWVVYPYDTSEMYRNEVVYSRSIWQLTSLDVIE